MPLLQLSQKTEQSVADTFHKYDVHKDVLLFHQFNLMRAVYKRDKELTKTDLDLIYKMIAMGDENPILTWLAAHFLWTTAVIDGHLIEEDCRKKGIPLISLRLPSND